MVFFTCNNCGESVKKKDVEKHSFRCKGSVNLTCVDCLKDFREDYVKHTVCVTEDQRYSASGLSGVQSQKSKQQVWVEVAHDCLGRAIDDAIPGLTTSIRELIAYLQEQPSMPDKPKPFFNYVKNSRRFEPPQNIEFVWKILEKALADLKAKQQAEREAAEAAKKKAKEEQMKHKKDESSDSSSNDADSSDDESRKKPMQTVNKKKQSKKNLPEENESSAAANGKKDKKKKRMVSESESVINGASEARKSKKKKKNPEEENIEESGNTSNLNNALDACHLNGEAKEEPDQKLSKKERKEKKKREKFAAEVKEMETVQTAVDEDMQEQPPEESNEETEDKKSKKKKKNKNKKNKDVEETNAIEEPTEGKDKKKKDKKSQKKLAQEDEHAQHTGTDSSEKKIKNGKADSGKLNETLDMEQVASSKFSWDTAILQVLESQEEISLKRLSKKVVNEYLLSVGDNEHVDESTVMNKFLKRLHKMQTVLVHKDKVRLRTSRD